MTYKQDNITIHNADCMDIMSQYEDSYFDLAVVDPPYFNGPQKENFYRNGDFSSTNAPAGKYKTIKNWKVPNNKYFNELARISKNQIIWGCNYYENIAAVGRLIWDKKNGSSTFSDCEIASCSLINSVRMFRYRWNGMLQEDMKNKEKRIHPTQKPINLYNWIYENYAKHGQKILDTHLGSGSNAIAAHYAKMGEFVGCELDQDYYNSACERIRKETRQLELF